MSVCWTGNTNPGKLGYLWLGGKLKPLDCRTNSSKLAERGQVMSQKCGKNEENSKECTQRKYYTFYVAGIHFHALKVFICSYVFFCDVLCRSIIRGFPVNHNER